MAIRCGHCHGHHDTVAMVRSCGQSGRVATRPAPMATSEPLAIGHYSLGGQIYRVAIGQSGHPYAEAMTPDGVAWTYAPGVAKRLSSADRMTAEDIAAVGRVLVRCIVCGARLSKPESRAAGIGPICKTRV